MANQPPIQALTFWYTRVQLIDKGMATPEKVSEEPRTLYIGRSPQNTKLAEYNGYQMSVQQVMIEEDIQKIIYKLGLKEQFASWYREMVDDHDPFYPTRNCCTRHAQEFFKDSQYILLIEEEGIEIQSMFYGDFNG